MNATPNEAHGRSISGAWYKIGAILLLVVLAVLFVVLASSRAWHEWYQSAPPAGSVPGEPGPIIAH